MQRNDKCSTSYSKLRRASVAEIDEMRQENAAYEYLCHLEEARLWLEECIQEKLPHSTDLETRLRNGVYFAKLGNFIAPHVCPRKKIFDIDQNIYNRSGLHYRHTDNINYWISAMKVIGFPSYFYPNSFDVYGKKNMPKAIYCLHALSLYLHRCGMGMKVVDLIGRIQFSAEEINSVSTEFKMFDIQLPAFNKIGGVLANEISPKDSTFHAAVIAINIAICHQNNEHLLSALMNPNAQLQNVYKKNAQAYQKALSETKSKWASDIKWKSARYKIEPCWEFLAHNIIQEEINSVNLFSILKELKSAAMLNNICSFINALQHPILGITDIKLDNVNRYICNFKEKFKDSENNFGNQAEVQTLVSVVNQHEFETQEINSALVNLNSSLSSDNYFISFSILQCFSLGIYLHDFGKQFYHLQLENLKKLNGRDLNLEDLQRNLPIMTALLDISMSLIQRSEEDTFKSLSNPTIKSWELNQSFKEQYFNSLYKLQLDGDLNFLSIEDIKKCIVGVNSTFKLQENKEMFSKNVNLALLSSDVQLLLRSLEKSPSILCVDSRHAEFYLCLLSKYKLEKSDFDLSCHEIQNQINIANKLVLEAQYFCACLARIHIALDNKDSNDLFDSLKILFGNEELCEGCKEIYLNELSIIRREKGFNQSLPEDISFYLWIKWVFPSLKITYYLNFKTLESLWNKQENFVSILLDKNEISGVVSRVQNVCKCHKYEIVKMFIISLQSYIRGFLVRRNFSSPKIKISRNYIAALKLQSFIRMSLVRKKYLKVKAEKLRMHTAAKIIQRQWRAFKVHKNLNILAHSSNPPLPLIQKIIYMLEISDDDYPEEFKLHHVKGKAVQSIRYNQELLREINEMDIKIGLLIRNRITLEDILIQKKKGTLKIRKKELSFSDFKNRSSKLFSKKYNALIESYENLLYLLQTKPEYLSRLIVSLPSNQATSLLESVIFSLYNYGYTPREEYLLLKMLCLTLEEEIKLKGDDISDIIKGENIIMKIIISFYRKSYWRDSLKSLLEPLVSSVLKDKCTLYSLDPIEIYKVWQNELEMQTGKKSDMPQEITVEDALCHEEVDNRFNQCLDNFLKYSLAFCNAILNGEALIPYGIIYVCKFLKLSLQRKYPSSSTEELNKIVGNFLYYRYINPAIIAPDVFDIITTDHCDQIADYERLKLSAIAKFLHFSVTGKKYNEEKPHLLYLNPYLSDCHEQFISFFDDLCKVEELEKHFNIDMFSEAIMQISDVYMSLKELQTLYKLLVEKEYDLATDPNDILHEILEDLNLNSCDSVCDSSEEFLNTEICLSLKSKYELEVEEETDEEKTFIETKFILVTLLQVFTNVYSVADLFEREPTFEEEVEFEKICIMKRRSGDFPGNLIKSHHWKTLSDLQSALQFNLNSLELYGYVTITNNYQDILHNISKDIVNRWRYRINRKGEIKKLLDIQKQLDSKTVFYLEKLDCYYKYVAVCLENMRVGKRNPKIFFSRNTTSSELQNKKTVKCSGNKLYEKGILIEIKDLDICQFKNVKFEISPSEDLGVFIVKAKCMGIPLEPVDIDFQELLCMQYQGISEMNMFESVKINNNLLLHFLNKKFYGKNMV